MLATAIDMLPQGAGWAYEFKWDGIRALLDITDRGVRLYSRAGNEVTTAYPELVAQAAGTDDALLDGEVVAFVAGRPSFEALQSRMHVRSKTDATRLAAQRPVTFVVFDVLRRYGVELTSRPYSERRATLERWLGEDGSWTLSPSFDDGRATEVAARQHGLEGIVAKRTDSVYRPGIRSRDWVKLRFEHTGDFVVVGWEAPTGEDRLSSLVLASWVDGTLVFAGKAGSGLTGRGAADLQRRLTARATCPLTPTPPASPGRRTHWVEPDVVVEVRYAMVTTEGRLRHPVFHRVRSDKTAEEAQG
jgi:bifunctional non-homologous end joining protein LigD